MSNTIKEAMKKSGIKVSKKKNTFKQAPKPSGSGLKKGRVKWFDLRRGYGFITADNGEEYFAHFTKISNGRNYIGFEPDDPVTFRINIDPNTNRVQAVAISIDEDYEAEETPSEVEENNVQEEAENVESSDENADATDVTE